VASNRDKYVKLKVGVKYCGGCNPEYDRVALVEKIEKILQEELEFVSPEAKGVQVILAVQGCSTACADLSLFQELQIRIITSVGDEEKFVEEINLESLAQERQAGL
jgi:hypothetical protein